MTELEKFYKKANEETDKKKMEEQKRLEDI